MEADEEVLVSLLATSYPKSRLRLALTARGVHVKVVLVLLVLKTVDVTEMNDVITFFATT